MMSNSNTFHANLFYSYSHKDAQYRDNMETALSLLRREGLLKDWSDLNILPGQSISKEIREKMNETNIFVFLISPDFINSNPCMEEWEYAKQLAAEGKPIFRIPIILRDCSWQDLLGEDDTKALPDDGKPVANFDSEDTAWLQVYEGIKAVINQLRRTFTPKSQFIEEMEKTDFVSLQHVKLQDIFVFPTLFRYSPRSKDALLRRETIRDQAELLIKKYILIHGQEMSGKTALGRYLFLSLTENNSTPVLHIDLNGVRRPSEKIFSEAYYKQFSGDYSVWKQQENKILILDNLSSAPNSILLIEFAKEFFDKIIITLSSDTFYSYFRDETRLANFYTVQIEEMNHQQQEKLIRKRLALFDKCKPVSDGLVDQIEQDVNSIITYKKIVPRYPFFVLSILQTYEEFMPDDLSITSYGHCYKVLIVANLRKAGISSEEKNIDACFNFAEKLAFKLYQNTKSHPSTKLNFSEFLTEYRSRFLISDSTLSRLTKHDYGIITTDGSFRGTYMYYFFLGRFLSEEKKENETIIEQMCEQSHVPINHLTLLFIIHHTNKNNIIDRILPRTARILDSVEPAKLDRGETDSFKEIVEEFHKDKQSNYSIEEERRKVRKLRDLSDELVETIEASAEMAKEIHNLSDELIETMETSAEIADRNSFNHIYQIFKNNEIMGQILRNRYGSLEKTKIEEIIETIADSGLRIVTFFLLNEHTITRAQSYVQQKYPDFDIEEIKQFTHIFLFGWTMVSVEGVVSSINVPGVREVVNKVVEQKSTPAYDLIGYFNLLGSVEDVVHTLIRATISQS